MLAALGMFVFDTTSALFEEMTRTREWRHDSTNRFGADPASQYGGPGEDRISLMGKLVPEIAGDYSAMETIAEMAATGEAYPLADGYGQIFGDFVILRLDESKKHLTDDGRPRQNAFAIDLKRVTA